VTDVLTAIRLNQRVVQSESKVEDAIAQAREAKDLIAGFIKTTNDQTTGAVSDVRNELEKSQGKVMADIAAFTSKLNTLESFVRESTQRLDKQINLLSPARGSPAASSRLVHINVGGTVFTTRRSTLESAEGTFFEGILSERFSVDRDKDGNIFIDRDPKHFKHILNWLRDRTFGASWPMEDESFHGECNFYGLSQRMLGDLLFMAYGYDGTQRLNSIESYNPLLDKWTTCAKMNSRLSSPSCAALGDFLYMTGGKNNDNQAVGTVTRFHPRTKSVQQMASLGTLRFGHGLVVLNSELYAVGGYGDDGGRVKNVERYNEEKNEWNEVAGLNSVRSALGCAVLNGHIYVAGGYGPSPPLQTNNHKLATVEKYDPKTDSWAEVAKLQQARAHVCCIGYMGKLWAIGGYDGEHASQRVECYDPASNTWSDGPPLIEKRSVVVCAVVGSKLYAVGGYDGQAYLKTTEIFDPELNCWIPGPDMPGNRGRHCVCALPYQNCV